VWRGWRPVRRRASATISNNCSADERLEQGDGGLKRWVFSHITASIPPEATMIGSAICANRNLLTSSSPDIPGIRLSVTSRS